jgi:hypothetical protein
LVKIDIIFVCKIKFYKNYLKIKQSNKKTINASFNNAIQDINNKLNLLFFCLYYRLFFENVYIDICQQKYVFFC